MNPPPFIQELFNLCPICVVAMPLITIAVMVKGMAKPNPTPQEPETKVEPEPTAENG